MTRGQIIKRIARETNTRQADVKKIIFAYEDTIVETLLSGEEVKLHEFLNFKIRKHKGKVYYNPYTKERRMLPPKIRVKTVVSENLKTEIEQTFANRDVPYDNDEE